jgi:hypothetical protein
MRTTRPDPYQAGYASGRELVAKVTDLTHHTERLQIAELRIPDVVPLGVSGRRRWLHGYANGIRSVLDEQGLT